MSFIPDDKLAVLIDADNAQASIIGLILKEVARYGTATIKRIYGDWTKPNLLGWKNVLHVHAIQPIQQFGYTTGKNATDSSLIIDAMDILHGERVNGFCLVSSDSDFTRLATRIRENGLSVYGFGEKKTPQPFVVACNRFIYTEILREPTLEESAKVLQQPAQEKSTEISQQTLLEPLLNQAISATIQDNGWALLSAVGGFIQKTDPSFDARNFNYKKLKELVEAQPYLETSLAPSGHPTVRVKERPRKSR